MARPNLMQRRYPDATHINWGPNVAEFLVSLQGPRPRAKERGTRLVEGVAVPWARYESVEEMRRRRKAERLEGV